MVALSRLGDRPSIAAIRENLSATTNPRVIIHGASALELFRDVESIPVLLSKLGTKMRPYVRDEIILSLAGILGFGEWFYPVYAGFLESAGTGIALLGDFVAEAEIPRIPRDLLQELLSLLPQRNKSLFSALAVKLLETVEITMEQRSVSGSLSSAVVDPKLIRLERFLFLVTATIIWTACRPS
jgi:hypothetical protein